MTDRVMTVRRQLTAGRAVIVYDPASKTANIVSKEDVIPSR
jgi:uncharacterized protein YheU (UPF0270 family)